MIQKTDVERILDSYHFPPELNVKAVGKTIEFTLPRIIPSAIKVSFLQQPFRKDSINMIITQKPKTRSTYVIKGGKDFDAKIEALLFILRSCEFNGEPIFIPSRYRLPNNYFRFLSEDISIDFSEENFDEIQSKLILDISQECDIDITDKSLFDKCPFELTTEEVYLLFTIFNPRQISHIVKLIKDDKHEPQIFELNIPVKVSVLIQYISFDKYLIKFADNEPFKAETIYKQIIEKAMPRIKSMECIFATFSDTDPIDIKLLEKQLNNKDALIAIIPDERTLEDEYVTTYVEIFVPEINESIFSTIKVALEKYYETVKLAVCTKCKMLFCPSQYEKCYRYFHKGKQIPFEGRWMEAYDVDEEEEEPIIFVNYSCCGECIKGETPMNCGKEPRGFHEIDTKEGIFSKLNIEKSHPGRLKF